MVLSVPFSNQLKLKCSKHGFSSILFGSIRQSAMPFVKDLTLFYPDFATIGRCVGRENQMGRDKPDVTIKITYLH